MFTDWTVDGGVTWEANAKIPPWLLNALSQDYAENVSAKPRRKPVRIEVQEISILFQEGYMKIARGGCETASGFKSILLNIMS